jgi:hypothetical protein
LLGRKCQYISGRVLVIPQTGRTDEHKFLNPMPARTD